MWRSWHQPLAELTPTTGELTPTTGELATLVGLVRLNAGETPAYLLEIYSLWDTLHDR